MKVILVLCILALGLMQSEAATDKVVCYYGSWAVYRSGNGNFNINNIDASLCTHLLYAFLGATSSGQVTFLDSGLQPADFSKVVALKSRNPNLKVMIAMGGWNEGSTQYSAIAGSASLRTTFATNVANLVNQYGFDGFDLDWEYPSLRGGSSSDKANLILLLKELRAKLGSKLLSMAVAAAYQSFTSSYDVAGMNQYLDFISIMAYDYHLAYDSIVGHHAPLYASAVDTSTAAKRLNAANSISAWIGAGASASKIILGIPIYGRSYTLQSSSSTGIGAYSAGPGNQGSYTQEAGFLGYLEICEQIKSGGWTKVTDSNTRTPYAYKGNQWVGFDDATSATLKVNYAKSVGLGGVMIWSIETEDKSNVCGGGTYPILRAINSAIGGSSSGTTSTTTTTTTTTKSPGTQTTTTQSSGSTSGCPTSGCSQQYQRYYVNSANPNIYYYCQYLGSGVCKRLDMKCPSNLVFNANNYQCVYA